MRVFTDFADRIDLWGNWRMNRGSTTSWRAPWVVLRLAIFVATYLVGVQVVAAQAPTESTKPLSRAEAVGQALQNNPALRSIRQQSGYAAAAVVLANTYPFNPVFTSIVSHNSGPESAGITNPTFTEDYVVLEIEYRGQGRYRRQGASATATRIEWEIANQELLVAVATIRAFNAALYRQKKLEALEVTIKLNEQAVSDISRFVTSGKLRAVDLLLAQADLENLRAQRGQLQGPLAVARVDLRRLLGTLDDSFTPTGAIEAPLPTTDESALAKLAALKRPDLQARRAAVNEAEAALKLVRSNRFGNPQVGPIVSLDPTQVLAVGGRISVPLPACNTKRGEIMKAQTDVTKVLYDVKEIEMRVVHDVQAALARLAAAQVWRLAHERDVVPNLLKAKQEIEKLFAANDPSADLSRVLAVERTYLKALETLLDARFEFSQAQADLALAVGEPLLAMGPPQAALPEAALARANSAITLTNNSTQPARALLGTPVQVSASNAK
jgi:outer membrane protein TolC